MKCFRKFDKNWKDRINPISRSVEGNVLCDFFDYAYSMNEDLNNIKKYYENKFYSDTHVSIDEYIHIFNKAYIQFLNICCKDKIEKVTTNNYMSFIKSNLLINNGINNEINSKYYNKLNKLANIIFSIETLLSDEVEKIWIDSITSKENYLNNKSYTMLAHVCHENWRKEDFTEEKKVYSQKQIGLSCSPITEEKARFFKENEYMNNIVGYTIRIEKNSFIGACNNDMFTTELINGKCPYKEQYKFSNVKKLFEQKNNIIFGSGTKICTPKSAIHNNIDTISEALFNKHKIKIDNVIYISTSHNNNIPQHVYDFANKINAKGKPILICPHNSLKQIDLNILEGIY